MAVLTGHSPLQLSWQSTRSVRGRSWARIPQEAYYGAPASSPQDPAGTTSPIQPWITILAAAHSAHARFRPSCVINRSPLFCDADARQPYRPAALAARLLDSHPILGPPAAKPAIAQLVEKLTVDSCSDQMVLASLLGCLIRAQTHCKAAATISYRTEESAATAAVNLEPPFSHA